MIRRDFCQAAGMATGWLLMGGLPRIAFGATLNDNFLQIATSTDFDLDLVLEVKGAVKPHDYTTALNDAQTYFWRQTVLVDEQHVQVYHGRLVDDQLAELLDVYDDELLPFIDEIYSPPKGEHDQGDDNDDQGMGKFGGETVPDQFTLGVNYPNPFRDRTTIPVAVPRQSRVRITVYDMVGRRVAHVVDRDFQAGRHLLEWHAGELPGGVYTIVLRSGTTQLTRQMTLIR